MVTNWKKLLQYGQLPFLLDGKMFTAPETLVVMFEILIKYLSPCKLDFNQIFQRNEILLFIYWGID